MAHLPVMEERQKLWYLHNACKGPRPMVVMEEDTFLDEILPPLQCEDPEARQMEWKLRKAILPQQIFQDDKVVDEEFRVGVRIENRLFGVEMKKKFASDGIGYHIEPVLECLEEDMELLGDSVFIYHEKETVDQLALAEDILGDLLHVRLENMANHWEFSLTEKIVWLMGMENMFCSMVTEPDAFHCLMDRLITEMLRFLRWEEEQGLLFLNHGNDYMGSGSFCFTRELSGEESRGAAALQKGPGEGSQKKVTSHQLWGHMNSQESVGISPDMYHEFIAPYFSRMAEEFGLLYYGCCEPVDPYWDRDISQYPNLRKVSISPWCKEEMMAERLSGSRIIYSRKPSPNFIGVQAAFDEEAFRQYIRHTAALTRGCHTEYIFRDIYKLNGNIGKLKRAVEIVREETEGTLESA